MTFRGDTNARVMIIGEAPGAEEDKLGVPFVGRAGKLLDEIFIRHLEHRSSLLRHERGQATAAEQPRPDGEGDRVVPRVSDSLYD